MTRLFVIQAYRRKLGGCHVRTVAGARYHSGRALAAVPSWNVTLLVQPGAVWIGAHWSRHNRRLCVNLLPFLTLAITLEGGVAP